MTDFPEPVGIDLPDTARARSVALRYAWAFLGTPYKWAGDDPMAGFDCSGLAIEALTAVGLIPHNADLSAAALYWRFQAFQKDEGYPGCLVFYFNAKEEIVHVGLMLDHKHVIQEAGGGSSTTDLPAAIKANAFAKIRPIDYRSGRRVICDPFALMNEGGV